MKAIEDVDMKAIKDVDVEAIEEVDVEAESNRVDTRLETAESDKELGTNLEYTIWLSVQFWLLRPRVYPYVRTVAVTM